MAIWRQMAGAAAALAAALSLAACADGDSDGSEEGRQNNGEARPAPTPADARAFLDEAETRLDAMREEASRMAWVNQNFLTYDTNWLNSKVSERQTELGVELAQKATRYTGLELSAANARKMKLLRLGLTLPAPSDDPEAGRKLAEIATDLQSAYGTGEYCPEGETALGDYAKEDGCLTLTELEEAIRQSRDPAVLEEAWTGWRTVSPPMKPKYARMVEIANAGAKDLGFADVGAMWRSKYDMPPEAFAEDVDRLWNEVKPLYDALQCHVRGELNEEYGDQVVPPNEPIPAHLLGNMWAQEWGNIYDLVAPEDSEQAYDLTAILQAHDFTPKKMVETGEAFFTSLGFKPLPETFWKRSLLTKPEDRDVVCHASAWDLDDKDDVRIKMCIDITASDFQTVHHELGHNFYQRAYKQQPPLFRGDPNDGFHEAIGDLVALSITPDYLKQIGLLEEVPPAEADVGLLLRRAMDKVAFLPFGLLVDKWRWKVFSGELTPETYNAGWWSLRERYQGVTAPADRPEDAFDPGAKYHIPANTPYMRYFLARIFQFQFHRAACEQAGWDGPLHRCSIYGNKKVGKKFKQMLQMGASKPWPEALAAFTGEREADATAMLDYFAPLKDWLDKQNADRQCGW